MEAEEEGMEAVFLGVGEACDERLCNTSVLLRERELTGMTLLLDAGFSVPWPFFNEVRDPNELDGVWISHFHGDHFFGLPLILLRLWETGRSKPLLVLGPPGVQSRIKEAMGLAYPGLPDKMHFGLEFAELHPGSSGEHLQAFWQVEASDHPRQNLALRLQCGGRSVYYSGDGRPTPQCATMAQGCDLMIHEAYLVEGEMAGHCSVKECLDLAADSKAGALALVHLQRKERAKALAHLEKEGIPSQERRVFLPEPGQRVSV
jgi:ribonuclease BN (tRNA processing enzyme)